MDGFGDLPLYFIENQGQLPEEVAYYIQGCDTTVYFTGKGLTFALTGARSGAQAQKDTAGRKRLGRSRGPGMVRERWAVKLDFIGADGEAQPRAEDRQSAVFSYFKGKSEEWKTGLPTYNRVVYPDLWPGIDLVYAGTVNRLKYEFLVKPGADPKRIRLAYRGATSVRLEDSGSLMVSTPVGSFEDAKPYAYQERDGRRSVVSVAYALTEEASGGSVAYGFDVGNYDPTMTLVLDPVVLVYCGFIGGNSGDRGQDIAVDGSGNAYVTGYTWSTSGFPQIVGPDLLQNGSYDVFVAKVRADGTGLLYCGYIGGDSHDYGWGIAVDGSGCAYVAGSTYSGESTFPVQTGPGLTYGGWEDAFVAKVKADGSGLDYCGYIGGEYVDVANAVAVDADGRAHVAGYTGSSETDNPPFPVLVGPDLQYNGGPSDVSDAFVARVKAAGNGLEYCGYIGGSKQDEARGIVVAPSPNLSAHVTGLTLSSEGDGFPVPGGPDTTHNGSFDAFVAELEWDGTGLEWCGYIGGANWDEGNDIALNASYNVYVVGATQSTENDAPAFPVVNGPDLTHNGGVDAFVAFLWGSPITVHYCGYIGGAGTDYGQGIAVDADDNAYVVGYTDSSEATFPEVVGPNLTHNGGYDAFVAKVKHQWPSYPLDYCGYVGGTEHDYGHGIALDSSASAYVTGYAWSQEDTFPVLVGPDLSHNGGGFDAFDAFVAKVSQVVGAPGDFDGDGDVDLDDYEHFDDCLSGPGGGLGPGCDAFDFDGDGDVDLDDYAAFQNAFTTPAVCGDGVVEGGEECDDGGESATCDADCTFAQCGDGTLNATAGEECDDGGESATCDADCTFVQCGDGTINVTAGEECDDGGESAVCDADCTVAECGDGTTNVTAGEECDDGGESASCDADCTAAECGDGVINVTAGEECDDGGESAVCDDDCTVAECGDGVINVTAGEECDDGGESATCDADCTVAQCGDGLVNVTAGEECDDGGESAVCDADCTAAQCGDGTLNVTAGEECDDGNTNGGDGCAADCTIETPPLPECVLDFDGPCPNLGPVCGAFFAGAGDCFSVGGGCSHTPPEAYRLDGGTSVLITLEGDLNTLSVFFSRFFGSDGVMEFFDADGLPVDTPLYADGDCVSVPPPPQYVAFSRPVRSIQVTAISGTYVWIDTFHVNPP